MIRLAIATIAVLAMCSSAFAYCVGTGAFRKCYDTNTGNDYTIMKFGNTTNVQGYNAGTGSSWDQQSTRIGNSTFTNGTDADGNSWNSTTQTIGGSTFTSGYDSDGNYFSSTCNQFGCY